MKRVFCLVMMAACGQPSVPPVIAPSAAQATAGAASQVPSGDPGSVEAALNHARAEMLRGDFEAADQALQAARTQFGERADVMNALSSVARAEKRYAAAIDFAKRVLLREHANVQAHVNIALATLEQGKPEIAEQYLQTAIARMPRAAPLQVTLGMVLVKRGQAGQGMAHFKKAIELDANNVAAHVNAGFLALAYRDYATADTQLGIATSLGAGSKDVVAGRCYAQEGLRQGEQAASCFAELLQRPGLSDNDKAGYYYALGSVHHSLTRNPKAALDAFKQYVSLKGPGLTKTDKVFQVIRKLEASEQDKAPQASRERA